MLNQFTLLLLAEAALSSSADKNTFISTSGMCIFSESGKLLAVNATLCQMLGYSKTELLLMNYRDIACFNNYSNEEISLTELLNEEHSYYQGENIFRCKNGEIVWASVSIYPIQLPDRESLYAIAKIQDVAASKLTDFKRHKALELAGISHQEKRDYLGKRNNEKLKIFLQAIIGFSKQLNESDSLSQTDKENLSIIVRNSLHLLAIVDEE